MKKIIMAVVAVLALAGCGTSYTFEADPVGGSGDEFKGDPTKIECFNIEADSSGGDDQDVSLGLYCLDRADEPKD